MQLIAGIIIGFVVLTAYKEHKDHVDFIHRNGFSEAELIEQEFQSF